jgi:NAD(P)-dependent dehydrogenase (short-subunit alcohol dehydrogenase family)
MRVLLVGASSDISMSLQNNFSSNYEFISLSSNSDFSSIDNFNILDPATFLEIDSIDGIVYFPGSINLKPFKRLSMDEFKKDYDINVLGLLNILKFYQSKLTIDSSVIFISSVAASVGMPFHSSISMCKSSLEALARSLAAEWAPKVRVNCVAPSLVNTKLSERFFRNEKQQEQMNSRHPLNKTGNPEDISNAIEFLLSKKSSWVTGQILNIDGGISSLKI